MTDEFQYVEDDAASVGATSPHPAPRRVTVTEEVSAILWGDEPASTVFLHGAALNAHTWDATVIAWSQTTDNPAHASALVLDLPGHGDSPWRTDGQYHPDVIAGSVGAALEAAQRSGLLHSGYSIVGQSLGGLVALELLRASHLGIVSVVLVDILPLPAELARQVASFVDGPVSFASREEIIDRAIAFGFTRSREALARGVHLNTRITPDGRVAWKHHLGVLGATGFPKPDGQHLWDTIEMSSVPISLVAGDRSFMPAELRAEFSSRRPGADTIVLSGGHNLQEDAPVELARAVAALSAS